MKSQYLRFSIDCYRPNYETKKKRIQEVKNTWIEEKKSYHARVKRYWERRQWGLRWQGIKKSDEGMRKDFKENKEI